MGTDELVETVLRTVETVAVIGCSRHPEKDAHQVPKFLQSMGYTVVPVNPNAEEILGKKCYSDLLDLENGYEGTIDLVDVFRPSVEVPGILEDVLETDVDTVWLQRGIRHDESRDRAEEAGLRWIQDRCMLAEYRRRFGETPRDEL